MGAARGRVSGRGRGLQCASVSVPPLRAVMAMERSQGVAEEEFKVQSQSWLPWLGRKTVRGEKKRQEKGRGAAGVRRPRAAESRLWGQRSCMPLVEPISTETHTRRRYRRPRGHTSMASIGGGCASVGMPVWINAWCRRCLAEPVVVEIPGEAPLSRRSPPALACGSIAVAEGRPVCSSSSSNPHHDRCKDSGVGPSATRPMPDPSRRRKA